MWDVFEDFEMEEMKSPDFDYYLSKKSKGKSYLL